MIQVERVGKNYAENVIDPLLTFEDAQTWTVSSGTGTCAISDDYAFTGNKSLKIENTDPTNDITVTCSAQNTVITERLATYFLSFYLYKDDASYEYTGQVNIFKNGAPLNNQEFTLTATQDEQWYRFASDRVYGLVEDDVFTFTITLDGISGHGGTSILYMDGIMLSKSDDRGDSMPPIYTPPKKETVETNIVSKTSNYSAVDGDIVLADATSGNLTVTLQSASVNATITVKKVDSSVNLVILDGDGAETIDGSTTQNITNQWDSITVKSDGSNWYII